jgi:hypothetical protein
MPRRFESFAAAGSSVSRSNDPLLEVPLELSRRDVAQHSRHFAHAGAIVKNESPNYLKSTMRGAFSAGRKMTTCGHRRGLDNGALFDPAAEPRKSPGIFLRTNCLTTSGKTNRVQRVGEAGDSNDGVRDLPARPRTVAPARTPRCLSRLW